MITFPQTNQNLQKILTHILQFPEQKMGRIVDLACRYRFSSDTAEQQEILAVLTELLTQDVSLAIATTALDLDDTVNIEDRRKVVAYRKRVGSTVKQLREERHLTQNQLADMSGLPQSHISRIEHGRHAMTSETVRRIAAALKVEMGEVDPAF